MSAPHSPAPPPDADSPGAPGPEGAGARSPEPTSGSPAEPAAVGGFAALLSAQSDIDVVGEAPDGVAASTWATAPTPTWC